MRDVVIFGAGGAGKGALQIIGDINKDEPTYNFMGFLDGYIGKHGALVSDYPVLGNHEWLAGHPSVEVVVAIANPVSRRQVVQQLRGLGHDRFATLIHPRAWLADRVDIGVGAIIYALVSINCDVVVGEFALVNMNSTLGHDAVLQSYVTVAPGARVLGCATLAEGTELGANSVVLPGVGVGPWSVLGAGAVATKSIPANVTAVGVPAVVIRLGEEPEIE